MKRVMVTGIGAVTPLGNSFETSWESLGDGLSGIDRITKFNASNIPWKTAGELKGFNPALYLNDKEIRRLDPFVHYAVAAAVMAAEDAGLSTEARGKEQGARGKGQGNKYSSSSGVIIGSSRGGISTLENAFIKTCNSEKRTYKPHLSAYLMSATTINMASSYIAQKLGFKGHCLGISNACASGANAIGEAFRLIKSGYRHPVFAGGAEAPVCRICIEGYGISGALSKKEDSSASRPFDRTRDGFVLAEGACVLVLENYENAVKRKAKIYGEIIGYGNTTDAFHQTKPHPAGEADAIMMAMKDAGIGPEDIDYINAHATSTQLGDRAEAEAIKTVFKEKFGSIPLSAIKSMTGHMLSTSGAFEAAVTLRSIYNGIIVPTINLRSKDKGCNLRHITKTVKADVKTALSNSFGFGGVNAVLAFRKAHRN